MTGQSRLNDPMLISADLAAEAALRELPDALVVAFDRDMRYVLMAGRPLDRSGARARLEGQPVAAAFPQELWRSLEPLFRSALSGQTRSRELWTGAQSHCLMVDVGPLRLKAPAKPYEAQQGEEVAGGVAVILDITARRHAALLAPKPAGEDFAEVFEHAPIGSGLLDSEGRWQLVNRALCDITGYTPSELIGNRFDGIMHPDDALNDTEQRRRLLAGEIPAFQVEKRYFDAAGETVAAILSMSLVRDAQGLPLHYIAQLQDISERKRLEEHLRHLADHDPLTGLRNRRLFEHDLRLQVARSQRYGEIAGLIMLDLDDFKRVNDRYGHKAGDDALRAVTRVLTRRLRQTDLLARLGGDEFGVLLPHIDMDGLRVVADGLARVISDSGIDVGDELVHPSASIGFILVHEGIASAEQALVEVDRAMYAAKRARHATAA